MKRKLQKKLHISVDDYMYILIDSMTLSTYYNNFGQQTLE